MNIIARLEYELAYYDSIVNRFNHYTTRTPPKYVWLNTVDCFFFKIFKWRHSSFLAIFLMSGSRWWRKYLILAQVFLTNSLVIFRVCVRLFAAVSFIYIYLECFYFYFYIWGWLILFGWVVNYWICLIYLCWMLFYL